MDKSSKILSATFFNRPVITVAKELVGKYLIRSFRGKELVLQILEVEAYDGEHDLACHASKGRTKRTEVLYGEAGTIYVYLVYGMHWMFNIVTGEKGYPATVLIRSVGVYRGPAKVTKALKIDKTLNGKKLGKKSGLWIEDRGHSFLKIKKAPRIGVDYAGPIWSKKLYRFFVEDKKPEKKNPNN